MIALVSVIDVSLRIVVLYLYKLDEVQTLAVVYYYHHTCHIFLVNISTLAVIGIRI